VQKILDPPVLNNIRWMDILYEEGKKRKRKKSKVLGVFQAERLIGKCRNNEVGKIELCHL
jgi:hypothetical protein